MISYLVKEAISQEHIYPTTRGRYEASNEELGERISQLLEKDGCLVAKQDTEEDAET